MNTLFISPPFGNYINLPMTTSIRGSFTLEPREGKWSQIFKTLRYSWKHGCWCNKIGLRNPGIDWAIQNYKRGTITSIAILQRDDVEKLKRRIPEDMDIEINLIQQRLAKACSLKKGMMQELLTGKTRLIKTINQKGIAS